MTTLQLIGLAIVQGLTEFLPVSSSGHLVLFAEFTAFQDQGLAMDVALHIGSLLAVLIYFHKTVWSMIKGVLADKLLPNFNNAGNKLAYLIIIASIPAFIAGFLLHSYGMEWLRNPKIIGWTILGYGLLLYVADKYGKLDRTEADLSIKDAKISSKGIARIAVQFVSEQINILKNAAGEVLEGDENFVQQITDVWTFEKDINSNSPVWLLVSTKKS